MFLRKYKISIVLSALLLILSACAKPTPIPTVSPTTESQTTTIGGIEEFKNALQQAGATVGVTGDAPVPFLNVAGQLLRVNGQDVQAFEFQDEAARKTASDRITQDASLIRNAVPANVEKPSVWAKGKIIVLYTGEDQTTVNLLSQILGERLNIPLVPPAGATPEAVDTAVRELSTALNVAANEVEVVSVQHQSWPDSCLGLGGANESCAQVITPGWQVMVKVGGGQYEIRTDESGSIVRWAQK